jgi:hypothetical protein
MVGFVHDDTVLGRFLDLGHHDCALVAVRLVEICELLERVVAGNVGVENEERGVVLAQNLLSEFEGAGSAQGFRLDGEIDLDIVPVFVLCIVGHSVL